MTTQLPYVCVRFSRYYSYSAFHSNSNHLPRHRLGKLPPIPSVRCQPSTSISDIQS